MIYVPVYISGVLEQYKWEDATTLQKSSWGYDRSVGLSGYATTEEIINQLVIVVRSVQYWREYSAEFSFSVVVVVTCYSTLVPHMMGG